MRRAYILRDRIGNDPLDLGLVVSGIVEIGRELVDVKERMPGRYVSFVEERLGWSIRSAQRFVAVRELFLSRQIVASDLTIDASSLYLIAAPST